MIEHRKVTCPYDMYENPSPNEQDRQRLHPRPAGHRKATLQDVSEELYPASKAQRGRFENDFNAALEEIMYHLCAGESVNIPGFGTFQASLKCKKEATDATKVRAEHIELKSVGFKPSKLLIKNMKMSMEFKRSQYQNHSRKIDESSPIDLMADYFQQSGNESLSCKQFCLFYGIKPQKARELIRKGLSNGLLHNVTANARLAVYVPTKELKEYMEE